MSYPPVKHKPLPENWQIPVAAQLLSTALAITGIAVSLANTQDTTWINAAAVLLGLSALALFSFALRRMLRLLQKSPFGGRLRAPQIGAHSSRWANGARDIDDAHRFFQSLLHEQAPSLELMHALSEHNLKTIRLVEANLASGRNIVGALIIAPLSAAAVEAVESKRLVNLTGLDLLRHVTKTWRKPRACYIGGIAGSTPAGRAWALSFTEVLLDQSGIDTVYARPVTADGLRVLKASGFASLGEPSEFWKNGRPVG